MYVDKRFEKSLKKNNPDLFEMKNKMKLDAVKEKSHGPGILFASGLIAGEAIMGIGLAAMAVSGIYLGIINEPSIYPGMAVFVGCAMLMARFSLKGTENNDTLKTEEWSFEEEIQEAEMVEKKSKKKK